MDHGAEQSEAPSGSSGPRPAPGPGASQWRWWARISIDVSDRDDVLGWSIEVHHEDSLEAVHVFPNGPFDDPAEVFSDAVVWLKERYGEQLSLSLF